MESRSSDTAIRHTTLLDGRFSAGVPVETLDHTRAIGLSLLRTFADKPSYILGITSALPGEGKTTVSVGLAEVMATDFGLNVVLLDMNAERPWERIPNDESPEVGLSDWFCNECSFEDALVGVHDKCSIVPFGTQSITSRDVLQYLAKVDALQHLSAQYSLVLLDLPDLANPAGAALANGCDGIVLVVRAGDTPVDIIKEFLPVLQNVTIHGAVLNRHRSSVPAALRRLFQ